MVSRQLDVLLKLVAVALLLTVQVPEGGEGVLWWGKFREAWRPADIGVPFFGGGGVHDSRRCVKCQDHAWVNMRKRRGSPWLQKLD
jgi:hypothetical protein